MSEDEDAGYCATKGEPSKGRHNFREEHPEAYNEWRKQRDYAEEHAFYAFYDPKTKRRRLVAVPKIPDGKEARERVQKRTDTHLRAYIKQVEAGTWPTKRVPITDAFRDGERDDGLPITIEVLKDPLCFAGQDKNGNAVNSIERALERIEASGETEAGYPLHPTDGDLPMRPLREASKFEWAGGDGWRPAEYDPADAWVERMDRRDAKIARLQKALRIPDETRRFRELDKLLDVFSLHGDDPGFASLLIEWVRDQEPSYLLHCFVKNVRIHQRGCHKKLPTKIPKKLCNLFTAEPYRVEGKDAPPLALAPGARFSWAGCVLFS